MSLVLLHLGEHLRAIWQEGVSGIEQDLENDANRGSGHAIREERT